MLRTRALRTHLRLEVAAIVCLTVMCGLLAARRLFASTAQPTKPIARLSWAARSSSMSRCLLQDRWPAPVVTILATAYGPPPGKGIANGGAHLDQPGTRAVPSLCYLHGAPQILRNNALLRMAMSVLAGDLPGMAVPAR